MLSSDPILCQQGHCAKELSINDKNDWRTVSSAFSVVDFTEDDLEVWVLSAEQSVWSGSEGTIPVSWGLRSKVARFRK